MKAFVTTMLVLLVIEAIGKAYQLHSRRYVRDPRAMVNDIALGIVFAVWAAWLIGASQ
jgi:hypothetical protein